MQHDLSFRNLNSTPTKNLLSKFQNLYIFTNVLSIESLLYPTVGASSISREQMNGCPRNTYFSDLMNMVQNIYSASKVTFQEGSMTGTCFTDMREGRRPENI